MDPSITSTLANLSITHKVKVHVAVSHTARHTYSNVDELKLST